MVDVVVEGDATDLDAIDATWLTAALQEAGVATDAAVTAVRSRPIGTGQVGENIRFALDWSTSDPALPQSVVGKFPSTSEMSRATAVATETYLRELGFYRDLQDSSVIRTPHIYRLEDDLAHNRFVLLMEDITPAEQGDQIAGCSVEQARLALDSAADLHASTWDRAAELAEIPWIGAPDPESLRARVALYGMCWDGFEQRYADRLTPEQLDAGRWLGENLLRTAQAAAELTPCLAHNDYRLDNMLFGTGVGAPPLTVVDWQTVRPGAGAYDVAYFLGAGLLPDTRADAEEALVSDYVAALRDRGVDADSDEIWRGYRLGSTSGYAMAVVASQIVEQTDRGDAMFGARAGRHAEQMLTLDVAGLVD